VFISRDIVMVMFSELSEERWYGDDKDDAR
jgi:hypothetical protein